VVTDAVADHAAHLFLLCLLFAPMVAMVLGMIDTSSTGWEEDD
jgi:hypothetical protein